MYNDDISCANKQRHLDLAQDLVLFVSIRLYLKSWCLPVPSLSSSNLTVSQQTVLDITIS